MLRDLGTIKMRVASILITIAFGVGLYAGLEMGVDTLLHTRDTLFERMNFADLQVQFISEDTENISDLSNIEGVKKINRRLIFPGNIQVNETTRITGAIYFLEESNPEINSLEIVEGHTLNADDPDSFVIEKSLAHYHGYKIGDRISIQVGRKAYEGRIDGICIAPEYIVQSSNPDYMVPEKGTFGVLYANISRVSDALGFTMINELLFDYKEGADPVATQQKIIGRLTSVNLEKVVPQKEHFIYRFLQMDMNAFKIYALTIQLTLAIVAFAITLITFNRLIMHQRQEIGALLALGYTRWEIIGSFILGAIFLGLLGGVLGLGVTFFIRHAFTGIYASAMGFPETLYVFLWPDYLLGILMGIGVAIIAVTLPVFLLLNLPPQVIIRGQAGSSSSLNSWLIPFFQWLDFLPTNIRFGIRNIFRRKGLTLATIMALALSIGIATSYVASMTSVNMTIENGFNNEKWNLTADFLYPVYFEDYEALQNISGVDAMDTKFRRYVEIRHKDQLKGSRMLGVTPHGGMKGFLLGEGSGFDKNPNDILLSRDLARDLKASVGNTVTVIIREGEEYPFIVSGITLDMTLSQSMIPFQTMQKITNFTDEASGLYIQASGNLDEIEKKLYQYDFMGQVLQKRGLVSSFRSVVDELMGIVHVATAISLFIALIFIFTNIHLTIIERESEYATLKSIGYGRSHIAEIIFSESLAQGLLGILLSLPLAILLTSWINYRIGIAWFHIEDYYVLRDFTQVTGLALFLIPLAAYFGMRLIFKMNITQSLRTKMIE